MTDQTSDESQADSSKGVEGSSDETSKQNESKEASKQKEESRQKEDVFSREYVEALRRENAKYRTENKQIKEESHKTVIRLELKTAALSAGIKDLDALKMFDTSKLSISADGDVVGVNELVDSMLKSKPYLFEQKEAKAEEPEREDDKTGSKSKTSSSAKAPDKAAAAQKSAMTMTDDEYEKMKRNGFKELA